MLDIYLAPTRLFERLKEKPTWLIPLIVVVVANLAVTGLSTQYFDWDAQREAAVERMQGRGMTEEQIDQALEGMEKFTGNPVARIGFPLVSALLTQVIFILFVTLIYNLALPLLGASGSYKRSLAVISWASLVAVPGAIVRSVLVLLKRSAEVNTSLLAAFPGIESKFLGVVLGRIDLFAIWQLILVGLGLKIVFDIKGSKSYWLAIAVWALLTLVFALLAMLGGGR